MSEQLNRIEGKVDRILELLESKESSTLNLDGKDVADKLKEISAYDRFKSR